MSQSPTAATASRPEEGPTEYDVLSLEEGGREVLDALDDDGCRAILEAVSSSDDPLSASEIVERCEVSSSSTYRKLDHLMDAGLLEQRLRIRGSGKHTNEYTDRVEDVRISIGDDGRIEVQVARRKPASSLPPSPAEGW